MRCGVQHRLQSVPANPTLQVIRREVSRPIGLAWRSSCPSSTWQLQGQDPTSGVGFPPWRSGFLLDFWVLGEQMVCVALSQLPSCPVPHTAGCGKVTLPFFFAKTWKQLHLCHLLPPPHILAVSCQRCCCLFSSLPQIWQQVLGAAYGQWCASFFPPPSPLFPCNNAVICIRVSHAFLPPKLLLFSLWESQAARWELGTSCRPPLGSV